MIDELRAPSSSPDDSLSSLVHASAPVGFDAGFSDRVLARLRAEREAPLTLALEKQFRRVVPLLAAASLAMAAYNWWGGRQSGASPLDAALNLPQVTVAAAYSAYSASSGDVSDFPEMP